MNKEELRELVRVKEEKRVKRFNYLKRKVEAIGKMDEDGYPNKFSLEMISIWNYMDNDGWFKFIEEMWHMKWFGWHVYIGIQDKELNRDNNKDLNALLPEVRGFLLQ